MADRDNELKKLADAVIETLKSNKKVLSLMAELRDKNVVDSATLLSLHFKINELLEISCATMSEEELEAQGVYERQSAPKQKKAKSEEQEPRETIDGRDLSENEIAFQEWVSERFDEENWLKKTKLIW